MTLLKLFGDFSELSNLFGFLFFYPDSLGRCGRNGPPKSSRSVHSVDNDAGGKFRGCVFLCRVGIIQIGGNIIAGPFLDLPAMFYKCAGYNFESDGHYFSAWK